MKKGIIYFSLFLLILISLPITYALQVSREVIVDTDVGVDDVIAILYLLSQPSVHIKAITIEADGNTHCKPAYANIETILTLTHHNDIPVACGQSIPLRGHHQFTPSILTFCDRLAGTQTLPSTLTLPTQTAHALMIRTLQAVTQPIDILAIGPLTTIAQVISDQPLLKNKIHRIYAMGGAVYVPGNVNQGTNIQNKVAEWNIYIDPYAANQVFHSGVPITLIPLDVTNQAPITHDFYQQIKTIRGTPVSDFVFHLFKNNKSMIANKTWYFWDPMAAVVMVHPRFLFVKRLPISVTLSPERASGATIRDQSLGAPVDVGIHIHLAMFKQSLLHGLHASI